MGARRSASTAHAATASEQLMHLQFLSESGAVPKREDKIIAPPSATTVDTDGTAQARAPDPDHFVRSVGHFPFVPPEEKRRSPEKMLHVAAPRSQHRAQIMRLVT